MKRVALGLLLAVASTSTAHADIVLFGWNDDNQGWSGLSGFSTTTGVTEGSSGAILNLTGWTQISSGWINGALAGAYSDMVGRNELAFDLTMVNPPAAGWENVNAAINISGQDANGDWFATDGVWTRTQAGTISMDYSLVAGGSIVAGTARAIQLDIKMDGAGGWAGGDIVLDNFRIVEVPEPTSLAALGTCILLLARRRGS